MNQKLDFQSLIIIGEGRSGTTLLSSFLNSQEGCIVYSDLLKYWYIEHKNLGITSIISPLSEREKNVLFTNLIAEGWKFGITSFDGIGREEVNTSLDLLQLAFLSLDETNSAKIIGTKMTRHYEYLDEFLAQGIKIIFCQRDPRDVLLSSKNRFSDYNLFQRTNYWQESFEVAKRYNEDPGFHFLRFEDLLDGGTRLGEIEKLSDFLGLEINPAPRKMSIRNGISFISNSSFDDVNEIFDEAAMYRWKSNLTSQEVIFTSKYLSREIKFLDYQPYEVENQEYHRIYKDYKAYSRKDRARSLLRKIVNKIL